MWMIATNHPAVDKTGYFTYQSEADAMDVFIRVTSLAIIPGTRLDLIKLNGKTGEHYVAKRFIK